MPRIFARIFVVAKNAHVFSMGYSVNKSKFGQKSYAYLKISLEINISNSRSVWSGFSK